MYELYSSHLAIYELHQFGFLGSFHTPSTKLRLADFSGHKPLCPGWSPALHSVQPSSCKFSRLLQNLQILLSLSVVTNSPTHFLSTLVPIQNYSVKISRDYSHNPDYTSILSKLISFTTLHLTPLL